MSEEQSFLFNTKTNKPFRVPVSQISGLLENPNSGFIPSDYDYAVQNRDTGEIVTVHGRQLKNALDQGYVIRNKKRAKALATLKQDNSISGIIAKQAFKEAFTLGLTQVDDNIKEGPYSQELQSIFDELYGTTKGVGTAVGFGGSLVASIIPPVAAAKVASIGAKSAQAISKIKNGKKIFDNVKKVMSNPVGQKLLKTGRLAQYTASKTPLGAVFNATIKAGDEAGNFALNAAKRVGVKNTKVLTGIQKTAQYGAIASLDGALLGTRAGYQAGKYTPTPEGEFNYKVAMQQGKDVFLDTAKWSFALLGGGKLVYEGIKQPAKFAAQKISKLSGPLTTKALRFSAATLNKQFFKTTDSPKNFIKLKEDVSHSSAFLNKNLDDNQIKSIADTLNPDILKKSGIKNAGDIKEVREKLGNIIKNSDENGFLSILREGSLILEKAVSPEKVTKVAKLSTEAINKQFFKATDSPKSFIKLKEDVSKSSAFLNKNLDDNQIKFIVNSLDPNILKKSGIKNVGDIKEVRGKLGNIIKNSDASGLSFILREGVLNLEKLFVPKTRQNIFDMAEKFKLQTGKKLESLRKKPTDEFKKYEKYGNELSLNFKNNKYIQDILFTRSPVVQKQIGNQLIAKDLMQLKTEDGMISVVKKLTPKLKIRSEKDISKYTEEIKNYFKKELNLTVKETDESIKMFSRFAKNNQELISSITDMEVYRKIVNKKRLSINDIEELDDIVKRNSNIKNPLSNPLLEELIDMQRMVIRENNIPKYLRVSKKDTLKIIGLVKYELNQFEKIFSKGQAYRKIQKLKKYITESKGNYMTFEELHDIKLEMGRLANFAKQTGKNYNENTFKSAYSKLSDLELNNFKKLEKNKEYKNAAKELIESRSSYSFAENILNVMDNAVTKGKAPGGIITPRDSLHFLLYGGIGGFLGGPLGVAGGIATVAGYQAINRSGYRFLNVSRKLDELVNGMSNGNNFFRKLKDSKKIGGMLSLAKDANRKTFNAARLSYFMYGREDEKIKSFEEIANKLKTDDPENIFLTQDMDHFKAINDVGGNEVSSEYTRQMIEIKNMIMQELPSGTTDTLTGKTTYTKIEEKSFYNDVSDFLYFENFFNDFSKGTISSEQVAKVQKVYPEYYTQMIISVIEAINNGDLKLNSRLQKSLDIIKGDNQSQFFLNLDRQQQMQEQEKVKKQRSGGVKFTTLTQPTAEQRIRSL